MRTLTETLVTNLEQSRQSADQAVTARELLSDDLTNAILQLRAREEVNHLYTSAKTSFGRDLSSIEEEMLHVVLEYVVKRIIATELRKHIAHKSEIGYEFLIDAIRSGSVNILPGNAEIFIDHDLVHIVLAIKQGLENENSVVPTFMQAETGVNTDQQAMLEEAFAVLFTIGIHPDTKQYDDLLKQPELLLEEARKIFYPIVSPVSIKSEAYEGALFSDSALGKEAQRLIQIFHEANRGALTEGGFFTNAVLLSQAAAFGESIRTARFRALPEREKVSFIEQQLILAQRNINALLTGAVPEEGTEKYKKTIAITRATYEAAERKALEYPNQPVFVEILLETLGPLYTKAQAQADTTFARLGI